MDVSDITRVVSRKRIREDAEQLREKVSRETEKIIKLKVAQDTAYWDLKEKLQQVEANHERLQQNMVEVQMQYEAVSGQYQDELRLRPETYNKVQSCVRVCAATEGGAARVRGAGARGEADRVALGEALHEAARRVHTLRSQLARDLALLALTQRHTADSLSAALEGRARAERDAGEAATQRDVMRDDIARLRDDTLQKNDLIENLRKEMQQVKQELREQNIEAEKTIGKLVEGLRQSSDSCATLERRVAAAAEHCDTLRDDKQRLELLLQESKTSVANFERIVVELKEKNIIQQQTIEQQIKLLERGKTEIEELKSRVMSAEEARREAEGRAAGEGAALSALRGEHDALQALHRDTLAEHAVYREESAAREAAGSASVAALMRDLREQTERRHKAEDALAAAREHAHQQHNQLTDKEDELNKQMTIILDMRNEKERLQEKIQTLQNTIDNIQKEVSGGGGGGTVRGECGGDAPQQDGPPAPRRAVPPPPAPPLDSALYSFMSDDSTDTNTLDAGEVRRRFESLRAEARRSQHTPRYQHIQSPISLSQARSDLKTKFFKSKRMESKLKKQK